jgi:hypothetical protein
MGSVCLVRTRPGGHGSRAPPLEVISQAVIEGKFSRDFPGVLYIHRPGLLPELGILRGTDTGTVDRAQQKTGVRQADGTARQTLSLGGGKARLKGAESIEARAPIFLPVGE